MATMRQEYRSRSSMTKAAAIRRQVPLVPAALCLLFELFPVVAEQFFEFFAP
jgi:hypothetical protein